MKKPDFKTFIKHYIRPYHFREVAFSQDIPKYQKETSTTFIFKYMEENNLEITQVQAIIKILNCLRENFYQEWDLIATFSKAVEIYNEKWSKIEGRVRKRMKKEAKISGYFDGFEMTDSEAFRELVARGFIPLNLYPKYYKLKGKKYFLKGNVGGLIYPRTFNKFRKAYNKMEKVGVSGFAGLEQPDY